MNNTQPNQLTEAERQVLNDWLHDPQVPYFSKAAAEIIKRLMEAGAL